MELVEHCARLSKAPAELEEASEWVQRVFDEIEAQFDLKHVVKVKPVCIFVDKMQPRGIGVVCSFPYYNRNRT